MKSVDIQCPEPEKNSLRAKKHEKHSLKTKKKKKKKAGILAEAGKVAPMKEIISNCSYVAFTLSRVRDNDICWRKVLQVT